MSEKKEIFHSLTLTGPFFSSILAPSSTVFWQFSAKLRNQISALAEEARHRKIRSKKQSVIYPCSNETMKPHFLYSPKYNLFWWNNRTLIVIQQAPPILMPPKHSRAREYPIWRLFTGSFRKVRNDPSLDLTHSCTTLTFVMVTFILLVGPAPSYPSWKPKKKGDVVTPMDI